MIMQEKLEQKTTLVDSLRSFLRNLFRRILTKRTYSDDSHRKVTLVTQIDFLIDTLHMSKLDIMYMERLKMPLTPDETLYFAQQVDRLNSSIKVLLWMRENVVHNETFWRKMLR